MCAMARGGRIFAKLLLFLLLVAVVGVFGMNLYRLSFEKPEPIVGSVVHVRNAFVDFYAAKNGARVLLFDAGSDPMGRALDALLLQDSAKRDDVTDVFLTHGHGDHLGAASLLLNAKVHVGAKDAGIVDGSDMPIMNRVMSWLQPTSGKLHVSDPLDGVIDVNVGAGQTVKAIPISGHTPGSYFYVWEKVLFTGDSIKYDAKTDQLVAPPNAFNSDSAELRRSLAALGTTLKNVKFERLCTGHGGCTTPAETKKLLDDLIKRMQ
jgi:glyoxylase-like metal-dependent hydrolase (beta-lactamase superfamily II)